MEFGNITIEDKLGKDYTEHKVFEELTFYSDFYESLSFSIMNWMSQGTKAFVNLDTYAISSIKGTVNSISQILKKGRINDSYALIRKYFDSTFINIYSNLYLQDHFSIDNFIVEQIDNWRKGTDTIPEFRIISRYIKESQTLLPITELLKKDDRYKKIRDRCNDNTHYNFFHNVLLNDNEIHNPNRIKYLDVISFDMQSLFIQHFAYLFYLNDHYFMSSDYVDYLDLGMTPEDDSQYWVAPFIQKVFTELINKKRPDIAKEIKENTKMKLE
ncbi:hypothetical protein OOZ15_17055 [Galbibacter sp. EGI 63066]|uniref:hypothetical protein n=1 Tax=Galbibacter sp. EGI 63066 TaxID=2993559 RepID=UPI00224953C5|nr:hypothetical protein [Galbibacter sp. EGI 63066]MCX2681664.1 hypothetical protein [Galbibacter sp. EGI 63066]